MQIRQIGSHHNRRNNQPSFGCLPLCSGNVIKTLKNGEKIFAPVDICLLRKEDISLIESIEKSWSKKTKYGKTIIENFLRIADNPKQHTPKTKSVYYLMVQPKDTKFFTKKHPLCIAELERQNGLLELTTLQTRGDIIQAPKTISGCGQMLLYGIAMLAKGFNSRMLCIYSSNHSFYEKLFKCKHPIMDNQFRFKKEPLHEFIDETRKKYNITAEPQNLSKSTLTAIRNSSYLKDDDWYNRVRAQYHKELRILGYED